MFCFYLIPDWWFHLVIKKNTHIITTKQSSTEENVTDSTTVTHIIYVNSPEIHHITGKASPKSTTDEMSSVHLGTSMKKTMTDFTVLISVCTIILVWRKRTVVSISDSDSSIEVFNQLSWRQFATSFQKTDESTF